MRRASAAPDVAVDGQPPVDVPAEVRAPRAQDERRVAPDLVAPCQPAPDDVERGQPRRGELVERGRRRGRGRDRRGASRAPRSCACGRARCRACARGRTSAAPAAPPAPGSARARRARRPARSPTGTREPRCAAPPRRAAARARQGAVVEGARERIGATPSATRNDDLGQSGGRGGEGGLAWIVTEGHSTPRRTSGGARHDPSDEESYHIRAIGPARRPAHRHRQARRPVAPRRRRARVARRGQGAQRRGAPRRRRPAPADGDRPASRRSGATRRVDESLRDAAFPDGHRGREAPRPPRRSRHPGRLHAHRHRGA
jgi:hypothetical protein